MHPQQTPVTSEETPERATPEMAVAQRVAPPIDVYEDAEGFVLVADVPGLDEESLELEFEKGTLSIRGRTNLSDSRIEYQRVIAVPDSIDAQGIGASLELGVLNVLLPKRAELKARRIAINGG